MTNPMERAMPLVPDLSPTLPVENCLSDIRRLPVWVITFMLCLLMTDQARPQWREQSSGTGARLWDVCFVDTLYGWAVGDSGMIIRTTDGGMNWMPCIEPEADVEFKEVQFLTRDVGFVGGNKIVQHPTYSRQVLLLRTIDGGATWERTDSVFERGLTFVNIHMVTHEFGYLGVNNIGQTSIFDRKGVLLTTRDAGLSWVVNSEQDRVLIGAVAFCSGAFGYSAWSMAVDNFDDTHMRRTSDTGTSWTDVGTIRREILWKAVCLLPGTIWGTGFGAARSYDSGQTWRSWDWFSRVVAGGMRFVPQDLEVFTPTDVWLVGNGFIDDPSRNFGVLMVTTDGGDSWDEQLQMDGRWFHGLSAVSQSNAWIVGSEGLILRFSNGALSVDDRGVIPPRQPLELSEVYPTPLVPSAGHSRAMVRFSLPTPQNVTVTIRDVLGREVRVVSSGFTQAGVHDVFWDGTTTDGMLVAPGVYFFNVQARDLVVNRKMILIH